MPAKETIHPLTSVRFFAAMLVVFYHVTDLFLPKWNRPLIVDAFLHTGFVGVSLFFVLSGYILARVYLADADTPLDRRKFWAARIARIYPLWLFSLLIHAPFVIVSRLHRDPNLSTAIAKISLGLTVNVLLVQTWFQRAWDGWNHPGWSLTAEALFYFLFPFIAFWCWRTARPSILIPVLLLAITGLATVGAVNRLDFDPNWAGIMENNPVLHMPEFILGIIAARLETRFKKTRGELPLQRWAFLILVSSTVIFMGVILCYRVLSNYVLHAGALAPVFCGMIVALANLRGWLRWVFSWPFLVLLGEASYAMYLLHIPLLYYFIYLTGRFNPQAATPLPYEDNHLLLLLCYIAVVIVTSIASFIFLETPTRKWIRERLSKSPKLGELAATRA